MLLAELASITMQVEGLFGLCLLIPIIWFIIGILLCIWVYRDAEDRGMQGVLWLIVVLIAGIIGLIIYLIVRKDKTQRPTT
jgi:putative membrane protein